MKGVFLCPKGADSMIRAGKTPEGMTTGEVNANIYSYSLVSHNSM